MKSARLVFLAVTLPVFFSCASTELTSTNGTDEPRAEFKRVVRVYNWGDYIDPSVLEAFTQHTGIRVDYQVFDDHKKMEATLLARSSGFDVVVPTAYFVVRNASTGLLLSLDLNALSNGKNLDPEFMKLLQVTDHGNRFAVPYLWGTVGIGYDVDKVTKQLGANVPLDSWSLIFNETILSELSRCGVSMLDSGSNVIGAALSYLGKGPGKRSEADYLAAEALLKKVAPYVRFVSERQYTDELVTGSACVVVGWSGDVFQAQFEADTKRPEARIKYLIPKEGTEIWSDVFVIPADAANPKEAHEFINFMLHPIVMASNSHYMTYANAGKPEFRSELPSDRDWSAVYPSESTMQRMWIETPPTTTERNIVDRIWASVKSLQKKST